MKVHHVLNCSFASWYPAFRKVTTRSEILPIPDDFLSYLLADGLVLPDSGDHLPPRSSMETHDDDDHESDVDWSAAEPDSATAPHFPAFDAKIKEAISELGGRVFPKLNWSSPQDARWIAMNNTTSCYHVSDIYLLLKSSDFITHDIIQPFKHCEDWTPDRQASPHITYSLILRKWVEIDPSTEFRCFVKNNLLIAVSQRDYTNFYGHINQERNSIMRDITSFFEEHIRGRFPDPDYVFDVYRKQKDVVKLVDFNPFGPTTDPLLFEWEELLDWSVVPGVSQSPEFRHVTHNRGVQPYPYRHYGLPRDLVDISTGEDPYKLMDLMKLRLRTQNDDTSSSEDEQNAS